MHKIVACPQHRGNRFFTATLVIGARALATVWCSPIGAEPPLARHQGGRAPPRGFIRRVIAAQLFIHARSPQRLFNPPRAKAARSEIPAARPGIGVIINIAERNHARDQRRNSDRGGVIPLIFSAIFGPILSSAARAQLAPQIGFELRASSGKARDISQREIVQGRLIERARRRFCAPLTPSPALASSPASRLAALARLRVITTAR